MCKEKEKRDKLLEGEPRMGNNVHATVQSANRFGLFPQPAGAARREIQKFKSPFQ